jgi:hypothetical protein
MGRRDYRWREAKKPKKDAKKPLNIQEVIPPAVTVEVIKKGKKKEPVGEEE